MSYANYPTTTFRAFKKIIEDSIPSEKSDDPTILSFPSIIGDSGFDIEVTTVGSVKHLKIKCTIYVYNHRVPHDLFDDYFKYIKHNILSIWDSDTGINTGISPKYHVDLSGLKIKKIADNKGAIGQNEVFFNVVKGDGRSRIKKNSSDRHGILYITEDLITENRFRDYTLDDNTPAHEFGHMLGLVDRYAYLGYVNTLEGTDQEVYVNRYYGSTYPIFLPSSYDQEYTENYGWGHNLYSTQLPVGMTVKKNTPESIQNKTTINDEKNYQDLYLNGAEKPYEKITKKSITSYSWLKIFITSKQLSIIENNQKEEHQPEIANASSNIFLMKTGMAAKLTRTAKSILKSNGHSENQFISLFKGSFIGLYNGQLISDNGYKKSRGKDCGKPADDSWVLDGNMEMRIKYLIKKEKDNTPPDTSKLDLRKEDLVCKFQLDTFRYTSDRFSYIYEGDMDKGVFIDRNKFITLMYRVLPFNFLLRNALIDYFRRISKSFKGEKDYKKYIETKKFKETPWDSLKSSYPAILIDKLKLNFNDESNSLIVDDPFPFSKIEKIVCTNRKYDVKEIWDSRVSTKNKKPNKPSFKIKKYNNRSQLMLLASQGKLQADKNHSYYYDNIFRFTFENDFKRKRYRWFELMPKTAPSKRIKQLELEVYPNPLNHTQNLIDIN